MSNTTPTTPEALNERFGIPDRVRFEAGPGGLTRAIITADQATSAIFLQGAHVAEYQPTGRRDVLFVSKQSHFKPGQEIRGGVPICFPWFGFREDDPNAPIHGVARLKLWEVLETAADEKGVHVSFGLNLPPFDVRYRVSVGSTLQMAHTVKNTSAAEATYQEALHTYFSVSQVRQIEVYGLEGAAFLDKTKDFARVTQPDEPIRFEAETDRVFLNHERTCELRDPGAARRIFIEKENSRSTVVWNPWKGKAARLPDFGDDEWPDMVCIESGNVHENAVTLAPNEEHTLTARLRVEDLD